MSIRANQSSSAPPRRPTTAESAILLGFHAGFSGAFLVAYLTGDDAYGMHVFAGYAVLALLGARLAMGVCAQRGSPLCLPRPSARRVGEHLARLFGGGAGRSGRNPLHVWLAAGLLTSIAATALAGFATDFLPRFDDLHEALADLALAIVLAHVGFVVALRGLKRWTIRTTASTGAGASSPTDGSLTSADRGGTGRIA